ncbi:hypothetical protein SNOG_14117 [Parastagonospora nodorum SN15]|uniref:Ubiquitin-like domain-containing protein n=2 Tax=Phaeosphaeria nodorum (strain SN15 / ATCC MYA-4574 / FGSC 10173) TaxID=321614 RepID=Q0U1V2_PHANO|nr:hypothetical protein SNOG_14117 [Parastagonospora nodorum SN15]EAT78354.1 hypothetical protein SNOG_14117 [Parastagonospora nodorum SN15]
MPVTFGSVGDIISVCLLVKDLVDALDKARGSKAEYQSLIRELWILDRSLLEIDLLARTHGGGATPELEALCETAKKAVDRCRNLLDESNARKQDAILKSINDRLDDTNRLIACGSLVTANIAEALRLDWLRQLGTELKVFMRRIIAMNIATYHAVISIQAALPSRLERSLIEEPFVLEDAIGRIAPVHLQFVTSWDAFNAVLEIRFRDMQGSKKVKQKQYGLQDRATKRDIHQSQSWERAFLPGQRIEMSFLFDTQESENSQGIVTCPGCQTLSTSPTHVEIQCENCRMWFRRFTILQDVDPPPQVPVPSPWRSGSKFGKSGFTGMISGPVRSGKRRVAPADVDGEDDFREFKRSGSTESNHVNRMDIDQVAPKKEKYWDPKWFPRQKSAIGSEQPRISFFGDKPVDEDSPGVGPECLSWRRDAIEIIPDRVLIECPCLTAPKLQVYSQLFHHLDPAILTVEEIHSAKESLAITVWSRAQVDPSSTGDSLWSRTAHPDDFIWPLCALSVYVSTKKLLGIDKIDGNLVAPSRVLRGTWFQLPNTDTEFYGASIGRWIFDWTCHYFNEEALLRAALKFWNTIYTTEKNMLTLVHSRNERRRFLEKADLNFSHSIVCYRCFWWQLHEIMTTIRTPNGEDFNGITSLVVEDYAKAFLKRFFFPTPGDVGGSYKDNVALLERCSMYFATELAELMHGEEKEAR